MKDLYLDVSKGMDEFSLLRILAEICKKDFDVLPTLNKLFTLSSDTDAEEWIEHLEVDDDLKIQLKNVLEHSKEYGIELLKKDYVLIGSILYLFDYLALHDIILSPLPIQYDEKIHGLVKDKLVVPVHDDYNCTEVALFILNELDVKIIKDHTFHLDEVFTSKGQDGREITAYLYDYEEKKIVTEEKKESIEPEDKVIELVANIDDMSAEYLAFAIDALQRAGAYDVFTTSIAMKKGRTGIMLTCMCDSKDREKMLEIIFKHTTTIGVREYHSLRYGLEKEENVLQTKLGNVHQKTSTGYGVTRKKYEYDDLAKIAKKKRITIGEVKDLLDKELEEQTIEPKE